MNTVSIIISMVAIGISVFTLLVILDIIYLRKHKEDKYENYRNEKGLLGRKKDVK